MDEIKDTSGSVASTEPEKDMLEITEDEHVNEETADVELTPLIDNNPLVENNSVIQAENFTKLHEEPVSVEHTARSDEAPQGDPASKTDVVDASHQVAIGDAMTEEKIKEENVQLENGQSLVAMDEKEDDSKVNQVTEATVKQEKGKEDDEEGAEGYIQSSEFDSFLDGEDSGTEDQQSAFMKEIENFYKERSLEFKAPKFYGEGLNCLKLWRQVTRLGGYDKVTSCKLWRQVGESFKPPKTCTTVSWTFRIFYEKALLEYEKHKIQTGELQVPISSVPEPIISEQQIGGNQSSGSGRARRDAAARAMQGWHSQRLLGNGEVGDPIIKDKSSFQLPKRDKHLKGLGGMKRKKTPGLEHSVKFARTKDIKPQTDSMVFDVGTPADWVKINVQRTKDCFEVYALVPGLLREEVHVQSDPAGRLVVSGEPEQPDNPWGVTPFKKVITLPSRIDPHKTSAVVTLHGQLFVRAPFENSDI
ncbi:AT-rich interactive domain-containing protein 5-like [Zingiber officinale]|uniref:AT-rich interactive domain-containing protein 3 n=1 Tax=Zingiber officinale TaxID=94328 RepID=A0A8J5FUX1_ZINOF|nr:AT-rich interactive domain-containing protein 5-like [Zingiber officinale]KAG6491270.1 hypothetical protein ZIOFF_052608 [Zingiber officinale]